MWPNVTFSPPKPPQNAPLGCLISFLRVGGVFFWDVTKPTFKPRFYMSCEHPLAWVLFVFDFGCLSPPLIGCLWCEQMSQTKWNRCLIYKIHINYEKKTKHLWEELYTSYPGGIFQADGWIFRLGVAMNPLPEKCAVFHKKILAI